VPLAIVAPGVAKPGSTSDVPSISTDLFPTLLAACGLPPREEDHVDGVNLLPALRNEKVPDRPLFWHYPHYGNQGGQPYSAIRSGDWKLIAFHDRTQPVELYNLEADPNEKQNVAGSNEPRVRELQAALDAWKKSVGAVDATVNSVPRQP
jgi:arylsulfatase A-like enzyme